jgi:hypothetical protein
MNIGVKFLFSILMVFSCHVYGQDFIEVSGNNGCPPDTVNFSINPDSVSKVDFSFWVIYTITSEDIDTSASTPDGNLEFVFTQSGNYLVELASAGDPSVIIARRKLSVREVLDASIEAREITDPFEYTFLPADTILDTLNNYGFVWTIFEDGVYVDESNVLFVQYNNLAGAAYNYTFPDTGIYEVRLQVQRHIPSCANENRDTIAVRENIDPRYANGIIPIANFFVPEVQDYFVINPRDPSVVLSFKIYSQSGVLVYSAESQVIYWDGTNSFGQEVSAGVYYYVVEAVQGSIQNTEPRGFIHLFR